MNYDFKIELNAKLSTDVVENMIRNIVEAQTKKKIESITMDFKRNGEAVEFNGCSIVFVQENATAPSQSVLVPKPQPLPFKPALL